MSYQIPQIVDNQSSVEPWSRPMFVHCEGHSCWESTIDSAGLIDETGRVFSAVFAQADTMRTHTIVSAPAWTLTGSLNANGY